MKTHKFVFFAAISMLLPAEAIPQNDGKAPPWPTISGFSKRLDHGYLKTALVDPDNPPPVELVFLSWNGEHMIAGCVFRNLGTDIVKIDGWEVSDERSGGEDFYPCATLEVSHEKEGEWIAVGSSPSASTGKEAAIFVGPTPPDRPDMAYKGSFEVNLDAFRPCIGEFEFGRVVLKGGSVSQVIVLTDLLPSGNK